PISASTLRVLGPILSHTDGITFETLATATNYSFYAPNVTNMRFQVGANPQVTITNDGKLGVGANLTPSHPLHVLLENNLSLRFRGLGATSIMQAYNSAGSAPAPLTIIGESIGLQTSTIS